MTLEEKTYKELCKQIVDRTNRPLTEIQKEIIKATIEQARNPIELMSSIEALLIVWRCQNARNFRIGKVAF